MAIHAAGAQGQRSTGLVAGSPANGDYRCAECGYGIVVFATLPTCPMCRGEAWVPQPWSPFTRLRPESGTA